MWVTWSETKGEKLKYIYKENVFFLYIFIYAGEPKIKFDKIYFEKWEIIFSFFVFFYYLFMQCFMHNLCILIYIFMEIKYIIIMLKAVLHNIFYGNGDTFFRILWWIQSSKEMHLFETEILCNILNISTVTFTNVMHLFTNIWHMYKLCYTKLNMSPKNKYTASKKDSFLKKSIYHCSTICVMLSWIYDYL